MSDGAVCTVGRLTRRRVSELFQLASEKKLGQTGRNPTLPTRVSLPHVCCSLSSCSQDLSRYARHRRCAHRNR
ncbi:protein of unknown function [Nitratireductor aquimarinus]